MSSIAHLLRPIVILLLTVAVTAYAEPPAPEAELVDVRKIWDQAPHNAFTDLVRFNDTWFCTFREGADHVSPDGALRVLESADAKEWKSAALIEMEGADLRDPKLSVTPDGRLMLLGAAARPHPEGGVGHQSLAWFSRDGREWSEATEVGEPNIWLWRVTWHEQTAYGVGYSTRGVEFTRLYHSKDGKKFEVLVPDLFGGPSNESHLVFRNDGACLCLLRRDDAPAPGQLGVAKPPYKEWTWKDLGQRIGGPAMAELPDGRLLAVVRLYDNRVRTSLCWIDPDAGKLTEFLELPSGGDTSYAGIAMAEEDTVLISYYSSHDGKTAIYLATVKIPRDSQ